MKYIDAILYVPSIKTLLVYFMRSHPEYIEGSAIVEFDRTEVVVSSDGKAGLCYMRFTVDEVDEWRKIDGIEILAEAEYTGEGTADGLFAEIFADEKKSAIYESVYSTAPVEIEKGVIYYPPKQFGAMR